MKKIAVYGSLRAEFGNNRLIEHCELLSTEVVNMPYKMVSLGGFPGLVPSGENKDIVVEIYEVDDSTYRSVERLESYPSFYQKGIINTSLGEVEVYVLLSKRYQDLPEVESGDWKEYNKLQMAYYA